MTDFTKEELQDLYICCTALMLDDHPLENWKASLLNKLKSMLDTYCDPEQEIFICHTGMALGDDFFTNKQHMTAEDLLPAIQSLANICDGKITESGMYAIQLKIVKMQ